MPNTALEEQLRARGLELAGPCEQLSLRSELLELSAFLRDFTPAEADLLGANMLLLRAQPGQLLIAEGEASDWMMLLLHGTVDVGKRKIGAPLLEVREPPAGEGLRRRRLAAQRLAELGDRGIELPGLRERRREP